MLNQEKLIKRIATECLRQGARHGGMITDPEKHAERLILEISEEATSHEGPQYWVVYHGNLAELTARPFKNDLKAAQDFMEQVKWGFWALVYGEDWQGAKRGRVDRGPVVAS